VLFHFAEAHSPFASSTISNITKQQSARSFRSFLFRVTFGIATFLYYLIQVATDKNVED